MNLKVKNFNNRINQFKYNLENKIKFSFLIIEIKWNIVII